MGGFLHSFKAIAMSDPTKTKSVRLPVPIAELVDEIVKETGSNQSDWLREVITKAVYEFDGQRKAMAIAKQPEQNNDLPQRIDAEKLFAALAAIQAAVEDANNATRLDFKALTQLIRDVPTEMSNQPTDVMPTWSLITCHHLEQFLRLQTDTIVQAIQQSRKQIDARHRRY